MILCLPFLMFQGRAQEAIDRYLETFPNAELLEVMHHPEGTGMIDPHAQQPGETTGQSPAVDTATLDTVADWETTLVATAQLRIGGQVLMIQDSLVKQDFDFSPSTSIAVVVDTAEEFSQITDGLADGGEFLLEPGDYDFAENYCWVRDEFGLSWQITQRRSTPEDPHAASNAAPAKAPEWS